MTHRLALVASVLLLVTTSRADAHRLDEYLVQTLIELEPRRVRLHVDLTPGVAVTTDVLPRLDPDHDGKLSAAEQAAYTEQVRRSLLLSLDGAQLQLRVIETRYPTLDAMTEGIGTIVLTFEAAYSPGTRSSTLRLVNQQVWAKAVYLVNCLMPRDPHVHIVSQSRSPNQASYAAELTFGTAMHRASETPAWMWIVLTLAGALLCWRASKAAPPSRATNEPSTSGS